MAANSTGSLANLNKLLLEVQQTAQALEEKLTQAKAIVSEASATESLHTISSITEVRETLTKHGANSINSLEASTTIIAEMIDGPCWSTLAGIKGRLAVNFTTRMRRFREDCRIVRGEQYAAQFDECFLSVEEAPETWKETDSPNSRAAKRTASEYLARKKGKCETATRKRKTWFSSVMLWKRQIRPSTDEAQTARGVCPLCEVPS